MALGEQRGGRFFWVVAARGSLIAYI